MDVSCECFVSSGRGLCDELITRLEESYLLWCVVCDLETSWPTGSCSVKKKNKQKPNKQKTNKKQTKNKNKQTKNKQKPNKKQTNKKQTKNKNNQTKNKQTKTRQTKNKQKPKQTKTNKQTIKQTILIITTNWVVFAFCNLYTYIGGPSGRAV